MRCPIKLFSNDDDAIFQQSECIISKNWLGGGGEALRTTYYAHMHIKKYPKRNVLSIANLLQSFSKLQQNVG